MQSVRESFKCSRADDTEVAIGSAFHSAHSQQEGGYLSSSGYLSGLGDALLDRMASFVLWATYVKHSFVPDAPVNATERVCAGKGAVAPARRGSGGSAQQEVRHGSAQHQPTRGTVHVSVSMRAPRMLGSFFTPWFQMDSFPFDLCDGPIPVRALPCSAPGPGKDKDISVPLRRSSWAADSLFDMVHLRVLGADSEKQSDGAASKQVVPSPPNLWHIHYVRQKLSDLSFSVSGMYVNGLALPLRKSKTMLILTPAHWQ